MENKDALKKLKFFSFNLQRFELLRYLHNIHYYNAFFISHSLKNGDDSIIFPSRNKETFCCVRLIRINSIAPWIS